MIQLLVLLDIYTILVPAGAVVVFIIFLFALLNQFLKKAAPGTALIKTGLGLVNASISTSSSIVIPLLHRIEMIDLTVKIVRIIRKGSDSLSCADGIRAEVEVDFYVKINSVDEDIRRVATTIGCERASNLQTMKELFEAKFADALKTAGSKLTFDQLYQNRHQFRDEVLVALGHTQGGDVILNGYRLDDVAIHYLEQLPLSKHDENNVLDAKGIKEIAQRTSNEAESANKRLREREVTIATQNQEARTKQLQIEQDLKEKEATQQREIKERLSKENALAEKTKQEQESIEQQALIEKERSVKIAEEKKVQETKVVETQREKAILVAQQDKEQAVEIAKIRRETMTAEQLKQKLVMLEETAKQEAMKIKAEEQAITVKAIEIANRDKQIQLTNADKEAQVQVAKNNVIVDTEAYKLVTVAKAKLEAIGIDLEAASKKSQTEIIDAEKNARVDLIEHNVEADKEAYKLLTIAKATKESSELELQAALNQSKAIWEIGNAEARTLAAKLDAENSIGKNALIAQSLQQLIPLLPQLIEKLMLPAEKIDSIKFLNINGLSSQNGQTEISNGSPIPSTGGIINTLMNVSMLMPVMKEVVKTIRNDSDMNDLLENLKQFPGGENLLKYIETFNQNGHTNGNGKIENAQLVDDDDEPLKFGK
jgi:flotillin